MIKAALLLSAACCTAAVDVEWKLHRVTSYDGTQLETNSYEPKEITKPLPLVVFINSWGLPGVEYLWPARKIAEREYIAVEYAARGWFTSGGVIGTASPQDVRDHAEVISWAIAHWGDKLNASAIATGGISYGAGISVLSAANDSRISAVLSFSGWYDLVGALWWNEAPSLYWTYTLLDGGAAPFGNEPKELLQIMANMFTYTNVSYTTNWALDRSPVRYMDQLNANNPAVLMSNQFEDNLFHSNFQIELYEAIKGPKKLFLCQGTHGEADGEGLVPETSNRIWDTAYLWLDHFLKGVQNDVEKGDLVQVSLSDHHDPLIPGNPVYTHANYSTWPPSKPEEKYTVTSYGIVSRGNASHGALTTGKGSGSDAITYTNKTMQTVGTPTIRPGLQPIIPVTIDIEKLDVKYEIAYLSEPFKEKTRVCGNMDLTGLVATANADRFQVMGWVWSVKKKNFFGATKATLLSHGPQGVWVNSTAGTPYKMRPLTFHAACRDFKVDESLMFGISLNNSLYEGANQSPHLQVNLNYDTAVLNIPTIAIL